MYRGIWNFHLFTNKKPRLPSDVCIYFPPFPHCHPDLVSDIPISGPTPAPTRKQRFTIIVPPHADLIDQTYSLAIIISPRYSIRQKRTYSRTLVSSYEHICIVYRGPRDEVIFDGESDIILCRYSRYVETNSLPEKMCGYMNLYF